MNKKAFQTKETIIYFLSLCIFSISTIGIFLFDDNYKKIKNPSPIIINPQDNINSGIHKFWLDMDKNFHHPLNLLLMQIVLVLLTARIFSIILRKIGQPTVIAEIVAGLALGPSFLGYFFPSVSAFFFPHASLGNLQILSQFGLIVFMFVVGMELDVNVLKEKMHSAILISHLSIIIPFLLGIFLAYFFFEKYAPDNINFLSFGLFLGIAMSITAFPVLVRIIQEKNLIKSQVGIISITCAAIDDISAWTILALILAIIQGGSPLGIGLILLLGTLYVGMMTLFLQPFLEKISKFYITKEIISRGVIATLIILMLMSSMITESLGIHALFGAFLAGVIMPTNTRLRGILTDKLEDFSSIFLLPLFFAYTGIRTKIQLLGQSDLYFDFFLILILASIGKIFGSSIAARISGISWRESSIIGILMNTRGLMELVVLNIGYDLGILSTEIFTMFVLMALVTTFITSPIISILQSNKKIEKQSQREISTPSILIPFGPPHAGFSLLNLAFNIYSKNVNYLALHLSPYPEKVGVNLNPEKENEIFNPILTLAKEKELKVITLHRHTDEVTKEIKNFLISEPVEIMLMGAAKTIFGDNLVGGKVDIILSENQSKIGIFLDRGLKDISSVVLFYQYPEEANLIFYISGLIQKNSCLDITLVYEKGNQPDEEKLRKYFHKGIRIITTDKHSKKVISRYSLVIVGYRHWIDPSNSIKESFQTEKSDRESSTSLLILKDTL